MKKIVAIITILAITMCGLCGCVDKGDWADAQRAEKGITYEQEVGQQPQSAGVGLASVDVFVDKSTGVNYLITRDMHGIVGITARLNEDGTVMVTK